MKHYQFNPVLLTRAGILFLLLAAGVHLIHSGQMRRHARHQLASANEAETEKDFSEAVASLERYLRFKPDDKPVRSRYALLLASRATSPRTRWQAFQTLRQALTGEPRRLDVRLKLAELAVAVNEPTDAISALEPIVKDGTENLRVLEVYAAALTTTGKFSSAALILEQARDLAPTNHDIAEQLAELYIDRLGHPPQADLVFDRLAAALPETEGLLTRARYRMRRGRLEGAGSDLSAARAKSPHDAAVLTMSAEWALRRGLPDEASDFLQQALAIAPDNQEARIRLIRVEQDRGRYAEALALVRVGLARVPGEVAFHFALADLLIDQGDSAAASKERDLLRGDKARGRREYLAGRFAQVREEWLSAARHYVEATRAEDVKDELLSRTLLHVARCYGELGATDEQLRASEIAARLSPRPEARLELARLHLSEGRVAVAMPILRDLTRLPAPPAEAWLLLSQSLIREQAPRPLTQRHWAEAVAALERAELRGVDSVRVGITRAAIFDGKADRTRADQLLTRLRASHSGRVEVWAASVTRAESGEVAALLARGDSALGANPGWLLLRAARAGKDLSPSALSDLEQLEASAASLEGVDRDRVDLALAKAQFRQGNTPAVERLCAAVLKRQPGDLQARETLFDSALARGKYATAEQVLDAIRQLEGPDGTVWRCSGALLAMSRARQGSAKELLKARKLLEQAHYRRPVWWRPALLEGRLDDQENRPREALANYRFVLDLVPDEPTALRRAVALLSAHKLYADADHLLERAQWQGPLEEDLMRTAALVALRAGKFDRACDLGRKAIEGKRTSENLLWLGRLLDQTKRTSEAELVLSEAVRLSPRTPEPWLAWVEHLQSNHRTEDIEPALQGMARQLGPVRGALARARALEHLARFEEALAAYHEVLANEPRNVPALERLAALLMRLNRNAEAETVLLRLFSDRTPVPEENLPELRRRLALVLTAPERKRDQSAAALRLLSVDSTNEASRRVATLVRGGREKEREEAIRELEQMPGDALTPEEQLRLAQVYDADGDWGRARQLFTALLGNDPKNPGYRDAFIEGMLQNGRKVEALVQIEELRKLAPTWRRLPEFRERLWKQTPRTE